ncbi:glutathione S-transferase [Acrasis kona]|uniref:glutathione transferase n=1 Tax=Acrasis kona TaxID=1008807 RepID=A0AAW2ZSR9_9EUKA
MSITLTYFDIQGKAEAIRLLFEDQGIKYDEEKVGANWPQKKQELISKGIAPFGQVPVVSIGDKHLSQTLAIMRYFDREQKLTETSDEKYYADALADGVEDWRTQYVRNVYQNTQEEFEKFCDEKFPHYVKIYEKFLSQSKYKPFFVTKQPTFADYLILDMILLMQRVRKDVLKDAPLLTNFLETMTERKGIKEYLASDRKPKNANNVNRG